MRLHYLLVVVVVSDICDVKVMSSTVAVMFAITRVVNNYNIRTESSFFDPNRTKLIPNRIRVFFKNRTNRTETEPRLKKSILHIPSHTTGLLTLTGLKTLCGKTPPCKDPSKHVSVLPDLSINSYRLSG